MLSFIISIATDVLSGVISDLIRGQIKAAFKSDIEKEVADQLLKRARDQHVGDLQKIRRKILEEIEILSARDPDLMISGEEIQLKQPIRRPILPIGQDKFVENELASRLVRLDEIVTKRREELGLPSKSELEADSITVMEDDPVEWKLVEKKTDALSVDREIKSMESRIHLRRMGGKSNEK